MSFGRLFGGYGGGHDGVWRHPADPLALQKLAVEQAEEALRQVIVSPAHLAAQQAVYSAEQLAQSTIAALVTNPDQVPANVPGIASLQVSTLQSALKALAAAQVAQSATGTATPAPALSPST